jgi:type VI secretion system protein ImpL
LKKLLATLKDPKKLFKVVRNPKVLIGVLGLGFAFQVARYGAKIGLKGGMSLWIALAVLVLAIVVIIILTRREKKKKAERIEDSLLLEADSLVMTSSGAQRAANEQAREELAEAIESLKRSKVAGGRSGKTALYELPWYLVLGRTDSGKSKMIRNSGLTFPGSGPSTRDKGVGPGRSVQWWFTSQAVVLESNGRFVDREDDADARHDWQGLLEVVAKTRGDVPVQGVVVSVSAEDLIRLDSGRLEDQARVIRQRLDATVTTLQAFTPVYLVVTKVDLVHGFENFFSDLRDNARDQVLGATLDSEQIANGEPVRSYAREFDRLYGALCHRRAYRMAAEERLGPRGDIYLFPLEFLQLRRKLAGFVKTIFEPNPYGENPMFRGFYFTSGSLEGEPVDMVVNEVSRVIGLPADLDGGDLTRVIDMIPDLQSRPETTSRSRERQTDADPRFLRELFSRVLPKSVHLAHPTEEAKRRRRFQRIGAQVGAYSVAGLLAVLMTVSLVRNRSVVHGVVETAREAALIPGNATSGGELENRLRLLEDLRARLDRLDELDEGRPLTMGFALYRGKPVNQRARAIYFGRLVDVLLGPSRRELGANLLTSYPASPGEYSNFFDSYRAYLMLHEPARADTTFLANQLVKLWTRPGVGTGATEGLKEAMHRHVEYAWRHTADITYHSANLPGRDPHLTDRAGVYIREFWRPENYYLAIVEQVNDAVPAFTLASVPDGARLLATDAELLAADQTVAFVPGAYTLKGWRDEVAARIERSEEQLRNDWILKEAFEGQPLDMRAWMTDTYRKDYVAHWVRFLGAVDVAPSNGVSMAATRARDLAGANSPLMRLMESAATNLRFRGTDSGSGEHPLADVEDRFTALHAMFSVRGEGDQARRPMEQFLATQGAVTEALRQLQESGDPGLTSTQYAKQLLAEVTPGETAISASIRFAERHAADTISGEADCTNAVRLLLRRPAEAAWGAIVRESQLYLDAAWSTDVWEPFQSSLTGKYPFVPSGPDAPFAEFSRIFAPGGVFWTFYDQELAPFLDRDGSARIIYRHGLKLGDETKRSIAKAFAFRDALYRRDPAALGFSFRVKPMQTVKASGTPPFAQTSILTLGGTRIVYDMGLARDRNVDWPGDAPEGGARLSTTMDGPEPNALEFDGPWAFFRLLDQAAVEVRSDSESIVRWTLERPGSYSIEVPYEFRAAQNVNPLRPGFFEFACPRQIGPSPTGAGTP